MMDVEIEIERIAKSPIFQLEDLGFSQSQPENPSFLSLSVVCLAASVHKTSVVQPRDRIQSAVMS